MDPATTALLLQVALQAAAYGAEKIFGGDKGNQAPLSRVRVLFYVGK